MSKKIPVTIVSGFLGAGKTTLINKVLKEEHNEHIAVVINEFGSVGVDHQFVLDVKENIYQMDNGCLCCTLRNDIAETLQGILKASYENNIPVDRILFETTGLADPAPIAHTFINIPFLNNNFILDAVLTVVDAKHFSHECRVQDEPAKQVGFADKLLISKRDLVDDETIEKVLQEVRSINALAPIQVLNAETLTLKDIFNLELFYATEEKILEMQHRATQKDNAHHHSHTCHESNCDCDHDHDCTKEDCGCSHHHECHEHHHSHTHACHETDCECDHDHDCSKENCDCSHHHECHEHHVHTHHSGINSFVLQTDKVLNLQKMNRWLEELVMIYGESLYRYKGIFNIENIDYQVIFQGVQMSFDISRGRDWGPTQRQSTLVFIGKDLPEKELRERFLSCIN